MVIKYNNDLFTVLEFLHVKPGKGGAFVRSKLKSLTKGTVLPVTFRAGEKVEEVRVEKQEVQYLYHDGDNYVFMDGETYDQYSLTEDDVGQSMKFVKEGTEMEISFYQDKPISVDPPIFAQLKVTETEPGVKGDTATNVTKAATVETGATVQVPIFVEQGEAIKIDTRTGEYVERVK
jgi:elongation factor P